MTMRDLDREAARMLDLYYPIEEILRELPKEMQKIARYVPLGIAHCMTSFISSRENAEMQQFIIEYVRMVNEARKVRTQHLTTSLGRRR